MKCVAVASGKGGTGKSTVSASLALGLSKRGYKVGYLDLDMYGPNALDILGNAPIDITNDDRFVPAERGGIKYISLAHIAAEETPWLWDGKDTSSAARQLLERTKWGNLDFLICDFCPGTDEEVQKMLPLMDYTVLVTVPSALSESNVKRMLEMCREKEVPILGLIKNMTRYRCPKCSHEAQIFPEDHSFDEIPTLCEIPLSEEIAKKKVITEFPVERFLEAIKHPVKLKPKSRPLMSRLIRAFLKGIGD